MDVSGNLVVKSGGTLKLSPFDSGTPAPVDIGGTLENNGGSSTITVDADTLSALQIDPNDGTITVDNQAAIDLGAQFNSNPNSTGATFDLGKGTLFLEGRFRNADGGTFIVTKQSSGKSGKVVFDGSSASPQSILGNVNGTDNFVDLDVADGAAVDPDNSLTTGNGTAVTVSGVLQVLGSGRYGETSGNEGSDLIFRGDDFSIDSSANFFSSLVKFNIGGDTTNVEGTVFSDVLVTNSTVVDLKNAFTIDGKLTIDSNDEVLLSSGRLKLEGNALVNGTITPESRGVTFQKGGTQTVDGSSAQPINTGSTILTSSGTVVDIAGADAPLVTENLTLQSGTELKSGRRLEIGGDLDVSGGTFAFKNNTDETILFNGGDQQAIKGSSPIELEAIEIDNQRSGSLSPPEDVIVADTADVAITQRLKLTKGQLKTNQALRLKPGARIIYNSTDGDSDGKLDSHITDDVVAVRTLRGSSDWVNVSAPDTTTYAEYFEEAKTVSGKLHNDLWIQGPANSDVPDADTSGTNEVNLFKYVEANSETPGGTNDDQFGWTTVSDMNNTMPITQGHLLYPFKDDDRDGDDGAPKDDFPKRIDAVGSGNFQPTTTISLSATDQGDTGISGDSDDGWNLIANPYLNTIDWSGDPNNGGNGVDSTACCGVIYTYDSANNGYISHNGTETSTGDAFADSGYVAPHQSFFVKATSEDGSPPVPEVTIDITADQVPDSTGVSDPFIPKAEQQEDRLISLKLDLSDQTTYSHATFRSGAKRGFDRRDAYQLDPRVADTATVLKLYSVLDDGTGLSINNLPRTLEEDVTLPLESIASGCSDGTSFGGEATMRWTELRNIPSNWGLVLEDTKTDSLVSLNRSNKYTFNLESSTSDSKCSKSILTKSTSSNRTAPLPAPDVVEHETLAKSSAPSTRFQLHVKLDAALPVEFAGFNGRVEEQDAILTWETASETDNAGFHVQQKRDGQFKDLDGAFVEGAGTTDQPQSYRYRVGDLDAGTHTFRLKQVNTDGSASFSDPIEVKVGLDGNYKLTTYPNPVSEQATVEFAVREKEDVTIALYNTLGQRVKTLYRDTPRAEETQRVTVSTDGLSSGLYIVRLEGSSVTATQRITVVK